MTLNDEKWECYLCGREFEYTQPAYGWLGNYHMLCDFCSDKIYYNQNSQYKPAMTYHYRVGDILTNLNNNARNSNLGMPVKNS